MAIVDYDTEGLGPPILTVEEAFERSSFFEVPSYMYPAQVGDFSKGMSEADHKILAAEVLLIFFSSSICIFCSFFTRIEPLDFRKPALFFGDMATLI